MVTTIGGRSLLGMLRMLRDMTGELTKVLLLSPPSLVAQYTQQLLISQSNKSVRQQMLSDITEF